MIVKNLYRVTSKSGTVLALEWDAPGERLLIATDGGDISIWTPREHVLNIWTCIGHSSFHGEAIIGAAFFHNGRKVYTHLFHFCIWES